MQCLIADPGAQTGAIERSWIRVLAFQCCETEPMEIKYAIGFPGHQSSKNIWQVLVYLRVWYKWFLLLAIFFPFAFITVGHQTYKVASVSLKNWIIFVSHIISLFFWDLLFSSLGLQTRAQTTGFKTKTLDGRHVLGGKQTD